MALQLILGNSGAGKSHYMFEKIITQSIEEPKRQFFVIVPEQFTMQTQKDLVRMHPRHGILNIDILSFERLAHQVFEEGNTGRFWKIPVKIWCSAGWQRKIKTALPFWAAI